MIKLTKQTWVAMYVLGISVFSFMSGLHYIDAYSHLGGGNLTSSL